MRLIHGDWEPVIRAWPGKEMDGGEYTMWNLPFRIGGGIIVVRAHDGGVLVHGRN
jgi:hypothetical protein